MLRSEHEYKDAISAIDRLERDTIPAARAQWAREGMSPENIDELVMDLELRLADLKDQVSDYERFRKGDLSMFRHVEQLGELLIAARIAKGWTQRELAQQLGVHETQVSRDERTTYHAITPERLHRLCEVLGIELHMNAHLAAA
jgi:HTH-type transcriptional regulator/antitoxin HigA